MKEETRECIVKARLTANEYQTFLKKVKGSDRPDNMSEYKNVLVDIYVYNVDCA